MDELRLAEMSHMFSRLCLIGSLMLITSNTIARQLSGDAEYIMNLKDHLFVLLDGVPNRYEIVNLCIIHFLTKENQIGKKLFYESF